MDKTHKLGHAQHTGEATRRAAGGAGADSEPTGYPRAPVSKKRIWIDVRNGMYVAYNTFDRRGEIWKTFEPMYAPDRAPTAGNMMLYSIVDVTDQSIKDTLAKTCDDQPFIAKAAMVWLFLADYQRWQDYFSACGVEQVCAEKNQPFRKPSEGDLFLACCDALIAAQNATITAKKIAK